MNAASGRLVVVDDDEYVLERVRRSFTIDGWTLTTFRSPIFGLEVLGATELDKELLRSTTTLLDALEFASQPTTS